MCGPEPAFVWLTRVGIAVLLVRVGMFAAGLLLRFQWLIAIVDFVVAAIGAVGRLLLRSRM